MCCLKSVSTLAGMLLFRKPYCILGKFKVYKLVLKKPSVCNLCVFVERKLLMRLLKPLNSQKQWRGHDLSVPSSSFCLGLCVTTG